MNCDILKSKLIVCEWNAFYFIEIAFIGFTFDEIKQCIVFFWDTRYMFDVFNLKGHYDKKIVVLLLISIRHHLNIHLQDAFSFLISCLILEVFIF